MRLLLSLLVLFFIRISLGDKRCAFQYCGECISNADDLCVWCLDLQSKNETRRCQTQDYALSNKAWCSKLYKLKYKNIISRNSSTKINRQLHPQFIEIQERPAIAVNFSFTYTPIHDYPLDVYYLMDFSFSSNPHFKTMENEAYRMYTELSRYSTNVKIGVGSYVEKPGLPYTSPNSKAYTFKNHIPLTKNITEIINLFKDAKDIENNDDQEAVLDALMQAMVCQNEVGWRKEARHVVVICTDGYYHSAGDGKMVGAIKPNDMKCHLRNNEHVTALEFDYPSVGQISKVVMDHKIKLVFAATAKVSEDYKALAEYIEGAEYVELREVKDKSNIADIIIHEYKDIIKSIQIKVEAPSHVNFKITPNCMSSENENKCSVDENKTITFSATLTIKHCLKKYEENKVNITALGLNEVLKVNVRPICQCECELNGQHNASHCNHQGSYECGVCNCNDDRYGDKCQCKGTTTTAGDLSKCKNEFNYLCSGRGTCRCGECVCQGRFIGKFCEIDSTACPLVNGKSCAGHGSCHNAKCQCHNEWTGTDCNCPDNNGGCFAPHSNEVCSGNGECVCGECLCKNLYTGYFCDDCPDCKEKRCKELENFAECNYLKKHADCFTLFNRTSLVDIQMVNKTEFNSIVEGEKCEKLKEDGSTLIFIYQYKSKNQMLLLIQNSLELPANAHTWVIVGSIAGSVILAGLITAVIWKITIDYLDYVEYKKFEEEAQRGNHSLNPLYKDPCVQYRNPNFQKTQ